MKRKTYRTKDLERGRARLALDVDLELSELISEIAEENGRSIAGQLRVWITERVSDEKGKYQTGNIFSKRGRK